MVLGKYSRVDRQASSPLCFRAIIAFFVAACILAVWMLNSSSPIPAARENFNRVRKMDPQGTIDTSVASSESSDSEEAAKTKDTSTSFEDNPGDLPEDAIKGEEAGDNDKSSEIQQKTDKEKPDDGDSNADTDNPTRELDGDRKEAVSEENNTDGNEKANDDTASDSGKKLNDGNGTAVNIGNDKDGDGKPEEKPADKVENDVSVDDGNTAEKEMDAKTDQVVEKEKKQETVSEEKAEANKDGLAHGGTAELVKENNVEPGNWETQATESKDETERQKIEKEKSQKTSNESTGEDKQTRTRKQWKWKLCNNVAGPDYIPCLDNIAAIKKLRTTKRFQHRERHCPDEAPRCLVPLPLDYKTPIRWPESRDKIWFSNVPHKKLAEYKKSQNWVKVEGNYTVFPGGGTQFKHGALHYIDFIEDTIPDIAWGNHSRVVLDVGCGVASFGGYLFDRDVLTMSFAPKDEHEAQVQLALERGIPAISAVMGTQRLPFPSGVFDVIHCARCRVKWHTDGGRLLLELNRLLRPGGYFVWSATPVYQGKEEDIGIWKEMSALTASICWNILSKKFDDVNGVGAAIYQKPVNNDCYQRRRKNEPPMCQENDDPDAAWYVPMESCLHRIVTEVEERGTEWPEDWPQRLETVPFWLKGEVRGNFASDTEYWKRVIDKSYLTGMGIDWNGIRNVMDMKAIYGGFAAALVSKPLWVMNVVPTDAPNTLPIIYERGLFGIHHDWCESFSTYPRTYDLLHADHLFSKLKKRCDLVPVIAEVDRILRPGGYIIFRDKTETLNEVEGMISSLHYEIRMTYSQDKEGILCAVKTVWRPNAA